jgi:pectin methylesterase-like acyl-CoA thioesterase
MAVHGTAHAATMTWYVATTGSDSSCSQPGPFRTIQFAVDCAEADQAISLNSEVISVAAGTYSGFSIIHGATLIGAGIGNTIIRGSVGPGNDTSITGMTINGGISVGITGHLALTSTEVSNTNPA